MAASNRKRHTRSVRGPVTRPEFPSNFAELLIAKEMALDNNCCQDNINSLVELYGMAVEHYENIGDNRYIDYQERMQKMLIRPDVLECMSAQNRSSRLQRSASASSIMTPITLNKEEPPKVSKEMNFEQNKKKRAAELTKNMITTNTAQTDRFERIVKVQEDKTLVAIDKAKAGIKSQDSALAKRLEARKRGMAKSSSSPSIQRSLSFANDQPSRDNLVVQADLSQITKLIQEENNIINEDEEIEFDKSAGIFPSEPRRRRVSIEGEIEALMDRWCSVKASKIAEITMEYDNQIKEIEPLVDASNPADIMGMMVQQLRQEKDTKITEATAEIDEKRRADIRDARSKLSYLY